MQTVSKVIAIGPGGRAQAPTRSDTCRAVIAAVHAGGMLDELLLSPPMRTYEDADGLRRGMYRSSRYFCSCGKWDCTRRHSNIEGCPDDGQRVSCRADVVTTADANGKTRYHVQFRLHDKQEAMRAVVARYGPDPSLWPYQSKAKRSK